MKCDIAIIGGGIIGSFTAYFLARTGKAGSIVVIEPDATYERASTPKGAGGIRQLLTTRVPTFRTAQCRQSWTGHYAQNTFDGNMILGRLGGELSNLYVAGGFSGHGNMHAPAVGVSLCELILEGRFATLPLERMSYQRLLDEARRGLTPDLSDKEVGRIRPSLRSKGGGCHDYAPSPVSIAELLEGRKFSSGSGTVPRTRGYLAPLAGAAANEQSDMLS